VPLIVSRAGVAMTGEVVGVGFVSPRDGTGQEFLPVGQVVSASAVGRRLLRFAQGAARVVVVAVWQWAG
jgi:hypothetical protein